MSASSVALFAAEGTSPELGYLCNEMFMAGARGLGLGMDEEISPAAQETGARSPMTRDYCHFGKLTPAARCCR